MMRPRGLCFVISTTLAALLAAAQAQAGLPLVTGQIVIPASRLQTLNLPIFPDGSMFATQIGHSLRFFAAEGGTRGSAEQGSIALGLTAPKASLSDLVPLWTSPGGQPIPSLQSGFLDPPPDGNAGGFPTGANFDRDYAGGGPSVYSADEGLVIQIYHGEYHQDYPAGQPFYTLLGMATSRDMGRSFKKLGLAIRPEIPPAQPIPPSTDSPTVASSSGSLVRVNGFFYLYFSDLSPDGTCGGRSSDLKNQSCITVARANAGEVFGAALHGRIASWQKYYRGRFSEPGIGGKFSPVLVTSALTWARWPMVVYDPQAALFLMADILVEAGTPLKTVVELRRSRNGIDWGRPLALAEATAPQELNFPSIVEVDRTGAPSPACNTKLWRKVQCGDYEVVFVREENAAAVGKPFTRDVLAVTIRRGAGPSPLN